MQIQLVTPPTIEPVSLAELKAQAIINSGSVADNLDQIQSLAPGLKAFVDDWTTHAGTWVEVLGYNAVVSFAAGTFTGLGTVDMRIQDSEDQITITTFGTDFTQVATLGMTTTAALGIGTTLTNVAYGLFSYFVAGVGYSKPALAAGVAPGADVIPTGKYGAVALDIGADNTVDVISATLNSTSPWYATAALAIAGIPAAAAGHVRMGTVTVMKSDGAFTFGITALNATNTTVAYTSVGLKANYGATYEKAYTGAKRYVRTIAKVLVADCSFGTSVIRSQASAVEDDLLPKNITTARVGVETDTSKKILTQTIDYFPDHWPGQGSTPADNTPDRIKIPYGNLQSVTHVKYKKSDWASAADDVTLTEGTDYIVQTRGEQCGSIVLAYGESWPSDTLYPSDPICIRFICGYATVALVPSEIKSAVLAAAVNICQNRGDDVVGQTVSEDKVYKRFINWIGRLWDQDFL